MLVHKVPGQGCWAHPEIVRRYEQWIGKPRIQMTGYDDDIPTKTFHRGDPTGRIDQAAGIEEGWEARTDFSRTASTPAAPDYDESLVEEIMDERKQAFRRWCFAKSGLVYRGELFKPYEIEVGGCLFPTLDEFFEAIDMYHDHHDETLAEAVRLAWQAWLRSEVEAIHGARNPE